MNMIFLTIFVVFLWLAILLMTKSSLDGFILFFVTALIAVLGIGLPIGKSDFYKTEKFTLTKTPASLVLSQPGKEDIVINNIRDYNNSDKVKVIQVENVRNAWGMVIEQDYKLVY